MLQLNNVSKLYGEQYALSNINLEINRSDFIGLIGANGAGKSTLMKVILGLVPHYGGEIIWKGQKISSKNQLTLLQDTKALIETPQFFPTLTGKENLIYFTKLDGTYSEQRVKNALQFVNLLDAKDKQFRHYSLGMKQKLGIARVFATNCSFIILDEPFNGLDPIAKSEMKQILKKLYESGKTLLVSSHLLEELEELSNRILFLENGQLKQDIVWHHDADTMFEISINRMQATNIQQFVNQYHITYDLTLNGDKIFVKAERAVLPAIYTLFIQHGIDFFEVTNATKQL
ncbi:ABC transporter ATP-binding protein [Paenibacillus sp. FA6]|uniref:ABC transporter ATP-binding protein n=1 Tax=Paenibacillus sp. FA6 TaxID=3413029 RepID=UPI003F6572AC